MLAGCVAAPGDGGADASDDRGPSTPDIAAADATPTDIPPHDAGTLDQGPRVDVPSTPDAPVDDASRDAAADAPIDVARDLGADLPIDSTPEASVDAGVDAPPAADVPAVVGACGRVVPRAGRPPPVAALDAPRPIAPLSTGRVTSQRPVFRWALGAGADGATVEVCRDRACGAEVVRIEATGTTARPAAPLRPGTWWWRLTARAGAAHGTQPSPTWMFRVGARDAPNPTVWHPGSDFNADGYADFTVVDRSMSGSTWEYDAWVIYGAALGHIPTAARLPCAVDGRFPGYSLAPGYDLDGDGFGDLVVGQDVFHGSATGLEAASGRSFARGGTVTGGIYFDSSASGAGDLDGDGFGDLIGRGALYTSTNERESLLWRGSATGVSPTAEVLPGRVSTQCYDGWAHAGDFDGDGLADLTQGCCVAAECSFALLASGANPVTGAGRMLVAGNLSTGNAIAPGDLNGDGRADVLAHVSSDVGFLPNGWYLCAAPAAPDRPECERLDSSLNFGQLPRPLGDLDGDGYNDVATSVLYRGGPTGLTATTTAVPAAQAVGDVDGDGADDLASFEAGRVRLVRGSATGPLTASPVFIALP